MGEHGAASEVPVHVDGDQVPVMVPLILTTRKHH
jgi:hypothetical protein